MIWIEPRYRKCLDALLPATWGEELMSAWLFQLTYDDPPGVFGVDKYRWAHIDPWDRANEAWHRVRQITSHEAACILERAAREWLEKRGAGVVPMLDPEGKHTGKYAAYHGKGVRLVSGCPTHAKAQLEAMLAVLGEGE